MRQKGQPFDALEPSLVLNAVESQGFLCDGSSLELNSYENRVYQIGIEEQPPLIGKFYRPGRWTDAQIIEEHEFSFALADQELPVVAPLRNQAGESLFRYEDFRFSLYPRKGGRAPDLDNLDNLIVLGRLLGRIHIIGASQSFAHRPTLDIITFGQASLDFIASEMIPPEYATEYREVATDLLTAIEQIYQQLPKLVNIRVHGDCHIANILWRDDAPHFVDLDDSRMAPAIQDIWMLLSGDRQHHAMQMAEILEGYSEFCDFDRRELRLIESLRSLRIMHHAAWLGRRWNDPAFPRAFPWFNTDSYWREHIDDLRDQRLELDKPTLTLHN